MKERWKQLSLRDQQVLILGAIFIFFIILYEFIWSPLNHKIIALRQDLIKHEQLLVFAQESDSRLQTIEKLLQKNTVAKTTTLLGIIQTQLKKSSSSQQVSKVEQAENNTVHIQFQKTQFDVLIQWLTDLWQQDGLIVSQITVTPAGVVGVVNADLILSNA